MDNEKDQEQMYQIQILQAFDLNEWNDEEINSTVAELYAKISTLEEFKEVFIRARQSKYIIEMLELFELSGEERLYEDDIIFSLLFKFEYFDKLHRCIVDYIISGDISQTYITNLMNIL